MRPVADPVPFENIRFPVDICVLFYGDYPDLARRVLGSIWRTVPPNLFHLHIGLNAVSVETMKIAESFAESHPQTRLVVSEQNIFKYPMMRRMFSSINHASHWLIWLDDDSHFTREDWWMQLAHRIEVNPNVRMLGKLFKIRVPSETVKKITTARWFNELPLETNTDDGSADVTFPTGGFWAARSDCLRLIDWPDSALQHNGGDYLLGEAMRQQGWPVANFDYGISVNDADRRSPSGTPPPY